MLDPVNFTNFTHFEKTPSFLLHSEVMEKLEVK